MGGATPDAYRIGPGQVARDYPADAAPVPLRKQPSLPTVARAPESSLVEQDVSAEDAVVRGKAPGSPRPSRRSRPSEDTATVAQQAAVARDVVSPRAGRVAQPSTPVREYAHRDEAAATYGTDPRPGVPVHRNWHRTTMRVANAAGEQVAQKQGVSAPASPVPTQAEEASGVGGTSRAQRAVRCSGVSASRMDRRERPARRGQRLPGLLMFLLGFISALLIVAAFVAGLYVSRAFGMSSRGAVSSGACAFVESVVIRAGYC